MFSLSLSLPEVGGVDGELLILLFGTVWIGVNSPEGQPPNQTLLHPIPCVEHSVRWRCCACIERTHAYKDILVRQTRAGGGGGHLLSMERRPMTRGTPSSLVPSPPPSPSSAPPLPPAPALTSPRLLPVLLRPLPPSFPLPASFPLPPSLPPPPSSNLPPSFPLTPSLSASRASLTERGRTRTLHLARCWWRAFPAILKSQCPTIYVQIKSP